MGCVDGPPGQCSHHPRSPHAWKVFEVWCVTRASNHYWIDPSIRARARSKCPNPYKKHRHVPSLTARSMHCDLTVFTSSSSPIACILLVSLRLLPLRFCVLPVDVIRVCGWGSNGLVQMQRRGTEGDDDVYARRRLQPIK